MYLKLTRLDNSPIWINAAFVVTVEPRKGGGSVVVPIGDGLDYDVRETTDQVLSMLGEAPVPTVVPVPAPKMLAPTPADVSPEPETTRDEPPAEPPKEEAKPAKRTRRTKKAAETPAEEPKEEEKPVKRTRRTKKAADESAEEEPVEEKPVEAKPEVDFPEEYIARLRKMMPGSTRKLWNTLVSQFKVTDAEAVIEFLHERGILEVGPQDHIIWK